MNIKYQCIIFIQFYATEQNITFLSNYPNVSYKAIIIIRACDQSTAGSRSVNERVVSFYQPCHVTAQ